MHLNEIEKKRPKVSLDFSFPLSVNTALSISITGGVPTPAQLKFLPRAFDLARDQLMEAIESAAKQDLPGDVDYTVE